VSARNTFLDESAGPPWRGTEPAQPSTSGSRPPTKSRTCSMTVSVATPRAPASTSSRITTMSLCQAEGRVGPSSTP
jgi:hypothetical protein